MRWFKVIAVAAMVAALACPAVFSESIAWREGAEEGSGYKDVTWDDTYVYGYGPTENHGSASSVRSLWSGGYPPGRQILMGWADLFTLVPQTSGGNPIVIDNATLVLTNTATGGAYPNPVTVALVTTEWLTGAAGTNEGNVNALYSDVANTTPWAAGAGSNFGTGDWSTDGAFVLTPPTTATWGKQFTVDITGLMQIMYDNGLNQGLTLWESSVLNFQIASSEHATVGYRPTLLMDYHYEGSGEPPIPEPGTMLLLGTGVAGLLGFIRRKRMG